jgi:CheY-like chemotaxis protein
MRSRMETKSRRWVEVKAERVTPWLHAFTDRRIGRAAELEGRELAQVRLTAMLSMTIHSILMLSAPLWCWVADNPPIAAGTVVCAMLLLGTQPLLRHTGRAQPAVTWLLFCCYLLEAFAVCLTGGLHSPFLIFLAVPPLYAGLIDTELSAVGLAWLSLPMLGLLYLVDPLLPAPMEIAPWAFNVVAVFPFALLVASVGATHSLLEANALAEVEEARLQEERARERAEEASAARSRFFSNVSHDLRTPLNAIVGTTELLSRDLPDYGLQREHMLRLRDNSEQLLELIDELLELRETQGQPDAPHDQLPSLSVLVVDDLPTNRTVARHMLQSLGVQVREASTGEEALAEIERMRPDLVLLDRHMPGVDGLEVARRVRMTDGQLPIVALSASAMAEDREACLKAGMDLFLPKPLRMDVLRKLLSQVPTRAG